MLYSTGILPLISVSSELHYPCYCCLLYQVAKTYGAQWYMKEHMRWKLKPFGQESALERVSFKECATFSSFHEVFLSGY